MRCVVSNFIVLLQNFAESSIHRWITQIQRISRLSILDYMQKHAQFCIETLTHWKILFLQFSREYSGYTGWGIKSIPIKDSNISARCRPKELKFLPEVEAYLKFFFHRRNMNKSFFLCSKADINKNFHLFWTLQNAIRWSLRIFNYSCTY
jgi:hypothetical protein